jgi:hypothetical protein
MLLVHPKKLGHGRWEVAWTWMPFFLAADTNLIKHVDSILTEEYKGSIPNGDDDQVLFKQMHDRVLSLITEKYPMPGLHKYLSAIKEVVTP